MGEPWHIEENNYYRTPTKHEKTLKNIHRLEHQLGMNPQFKFQCQECRGHAQDSLVNKIISRYDPDIEGVLHK